MSSKPRILPHFSCVSKPYNYSGFRSRVRKWSTQISALDCADIDRLAKEKAFGSARPITIRIPTGWIPIGGKTRNLCSYPSATSPTGQAVETADHAVETAGQAVETAGQAGEPADEAAVQVVIGHCFYVDMRPTQNAAEELRAGYSQAPSSSQQASGSTAGQTNLSR